MVNSPWKPISSAPLDGEVILVTETPNGEIWNVMPAVYMNPGSGPGWWGVCPSRRSDEQGPLPTKWLPLSITPVCWMPMPKPETDVKLRRRLSQLFKKKVSRNAKALSNPRLQSDRPY